MKRDMDLVRDILVEMEKWPANHTSGGITIEGRTQDEITHHLGLMHGAGLIEAIDASSHDGEAWIPVKILWDGHEFLDAARSDTVWSKAKQRAMSTAGTMTLEAMKAALAYVTKQLITGSI